MTQKQKNFLIIILLFLGTFLIYKNIYPQPRNWYNHFLYLAKSFISGRVDVPDLPSFYHDKIILDKKIFLPFPPMPALVLIPFILLIKDITQQEISILFGSLNTILTYILLSKFVNYKKALLLSIFFALGTANFWSSVVGTSWYFAHIIAVFFFFLSLISFSYKKDFLSGVSLGAATLSRLPILLGAVFFFLELRKEKKRLFRFSIGLIPSIVALLVYNWLRFGNIFETGYLDIYKDYQKLGYPYTIFHLLNPNFPHFFYIDPRNIPLHLFNFLLMPPIFTSKGLVASPYGMGIIFTSPLFLPALWPKFKNKLERNIYLGCLSIATVDFMHYAQGWVQFGYRFILDFIPFLLILLALRIKINKSTLLLTLISVIVNFWGVHQGIKFGW